MEREKVNFFPLCSVPRFINAKEVYADIKKSIVTILSIDQVHYYGAYSVGCECMVLYDHMYSKPMYNV